MKKQEHVEIIKKGIGITVQPSQQFSDRSQGQHAFEKPVA